LPRIAIVRFLSTNSRGVIDGAGNTEAKISRQSNSVVIHRGLVQILSLYEYLY